MLPISGWMGDNLIKKPENMDLWKGMDIEVSMDEEVEFLPNHTASNPFTAGKMLPVEMHHQDEDDNEDENEDEQTCEVEFQRMD